MMDFKAIGAAVNNAAESVGHGNNAHWLRDCWRACGLTMRFTVGTVALLHEIGNPCAVQSDEDFTDDDAFDVAIFCSDEWRDECVVAISAGGEFLESFREDIRSHMNRKRRARAAAAATDMINAARDRAAVEGDGDDDDGGESPSWWLSAIVAVAKNTGWSEQYITWQLPLWRLSGYVTAIEEANGDKNSRTIDKSVLAAAEELAKHIPTQEKPNGEESSS